MFLGRCLTTTARFQSGCMSHLGGDGDFGQRLFGSKPAREEQGILLGGVFQPHASGDFHHRVCSCLEGSIKVSQHYHGAAGHDTRCSGEDFGTSVPYSLGEEYVLHMTVLSCFFLGRSSTTTSPLRP
ncbi:unnamed protein product, partial [Ixodes pacificus]